MMAVLPDNKRAQAWAQLMQDLSADGQEIAITKADLRAAVDALDTFLENTAATINAAIPQPARANLTTSQKARILAAVTLYRYGGIE